MIVIEIVSTNVDVKEGTSRRTQEPYRIRQQIAMLDINGERRKIYVPLEDKQEPYPLGKYVISDTSYYVGDFNSLLLGRLRLLPAPSTDKKAA